MNERELLQTLQTSSVAKQILEADFDFILVKESFTPPLFRLRDSIGYEAVGTDASGGEFVLCGDGVSTPRPLLYASSEGQAGVIARSLEEGLSIIIELPFWKDCLKFSGGGNLDEMRRVAPFAEQDFREDNPGIAAQQEALRTLLWLSPIPDSVHALHTAVTQLSPRYIVCSSDGCEFASLFNTFTVASNPEWRDKL